MQYFSAETFRFLDDLTVHRDKAWFETNRDRYEGNLLGPLRSRRRRHRPALREHIPDCEIRPNVNKTITRINRDMRFARGQSPYKNNMLALFYREGRKKQDAQIFVGLQPDGVWGRTLRTDPAVGRRGADGGSARGRCRTRRCARPGGRARYIDGSDRLQEIWRDRSPARRGPMRTASFRGPHLCALRTYEPDEVAADAPAFLDSTRELAGRTGPAVGSLFGGRVTMRGVCLGVLLVAGAGGAAADEAAVDILRKVDGRDRGEDLVATLELVLTDRAGDKRLRTGKIYRRSEANGRSKQITAFLSPSNIRNTAFLTIDNDGGRRLHVAVSAGVAQDQARASGEPWLEFRGHRLLQRGTSRSASSTRITTPRSSNGRPWTGWKWRRCGFDPRTDALKRNLGFDHSVVMVRLDSYIITDQVFYRRGELIKKNHASDIERIDDI